MSSEDEFGTFELETLKNMEREGIREFQFRSDDEAGMLSNSPMLYHINMLSTNLVMIQISIGQKSEDGHTSSTPVDVKRGLGRTRQFWTLRPASFTRTKAVPGHSIWPKRLVSK